MSNVTILKDVSYIDVETGEIVENTNLIIENGIIKNISKTVSLVSDKTIDCKEKIAVPGLFECHAHLCSLYMEETKEEVLKDFVKKGITQVRDVGGSIHIMKEIKDSISRKEFVGPDIFYSGPILQAGELSWEAINKTFPDFTVSINSNYDVDKIIENLCNNGASFIKTFYRFDKEVMRYFVSEAKKNQLKITHDVGHMLFNAIPVELGLELGIDCFEHSFAAYSSVLKDSFIDELKSFMKNGTNEKAQEFFVKLLSLGCDSVSENKLRNISNIMIQKNAYFCPTLLANEIDSKPEEQKEVFRSIQTICDYLTKKMIEVGVKMLVGVDRRTAETLKEMKLLHDLGLSNIEILRGATIYPAKWLQITNQYGSIDVNKKANLLILNKSPLSDIANIEDVAFVLKEGELIV